MRCVKQLERFIRLKSEQQDSVTDSCLPGVEDGVNKDSSTLDFGNLEQTRALVASLETCLRFSKCISSIMPTLVQLLAPSSATEVKNTILLLLMRCRQFQIDDSETYLRKMLPLVFSQDKSIHATVKDAFITIYLTRNPTETAANLLSIAIESSIGNLAALEFIVGSLVSKGDISTSTLRNKTHNLCMRCGRGSYHLQKSRCAACGYPAARNRKYNWSVKEIWRKTTGTGRMRYLRHLPRRFKSNFREGAQAALRKSAAAASF
ncbi:condensin-1 complex subunit CAP-D2-like [Magnolia sinica]|uniref:condensin-1 complex subunit CAP-D2-like n=1 Tax=Magnolia sinica TaxID=86752 RepID=UPI00265AF637|nr:condensin-1 complex subunit CAP-D2-like [Magnolia sinica]